MAENDTPFKALELSALADGTGFERPYFHTFNPVRSSSYALEVMTDLRFVPAGTIRSDIDLEAATQKMIARGVRLLLVIDREECVVGLITSRDLLGERPERAVAETGRSYHELSVAEVMTPGSEVEVLPLEEVLFARVGDVVETLKNSGRQHALVAEAEPVSGRPMIRGIFSASQIARQLGIPLQNSEVSQTFAQIKAAIDADGA